MLGDHLWDVNALDSYNETFIQLGLEILTERTNSIHVLINL